MKVKELVAMLLKEDQELQVVKTSDNFELKGSLVNLNLIRVVPGRRKLQQCVDAFDYQSYTADVWVEEKGGQNIVII